MSGEEDAPGTEPGAGCLWAGKVPLWRESARTALDKHGLSQGVWGGEGRNSQSGERGGGSREMSSPGTMVCSPVLGGRHWWTFCRKGDLWVLENQSTAGAHEFLVAAVTNHSKSPTYEPSSCELSKMWTCMPAPVCQLFYCITVLFKVLYCKIKNDLFVVFVFYVHIICVKSIMNLLQYSTV